jgi:LuxR family maltose regulon positive regulatory protein
MDAPLLQTKFFIPTLRSDPATGHRPSRIPRPRLLEQLDAGLPAKLTLISAPAGFGKTTLLSDWLASLEARDLRKETSKADPDLHNDLNRTAIQASSLKPQASKVAWLSLDEDDNDLARFLTYLIAAVQIILPRVGTQALALLQSSPLPPTHTLLTLLINDLTARSEQVILVLDDYHMIETHTIDQALTFLLEHLPPHMHLVLSSRADPNLSLARLRASGQVNELRSADLRFTQAETALFLEQMTGLRLSAAEVTALDQRIEGWIAGLHLAALSLYQRGEVAASQFIEAFSGSHRYIMDYLVDEVLQQQPVEVQTFLLYTSILDRLCGPLCAALVCGGAAPDSGRGWAAPPVAPDAATAQARLAYLEQANLFITPLDDQRHWYRYHALFADLLRHRLDQLYPDLVATLHLRASHWYEQVGLTDPALHHALAAQAFGRAAALLEQVAPTMMQHSELARLLTWIDMLPEDALQARPLLALYYVQALFFRGQLKQAVTLLEAIEALLEADTAKRTPLVLAHTAGIRAYLARLVGEFVATIALSRQALAQLPEQDALLRANVIYNLAIAHYLQGEFESASQLLTENITSGQTAQRAATTLSAMYLKAQLLRAQGALQQALQLCQEGLELVARHGWHHFPAAGFLDVTFGDLLRERNELSTAAEYLERGIQRGQEGGHPYILISGNVWLAWLRQTQGDMVGSQEAIRAALQVDQQYEVSRFWPLPPAACYQARLWIAQGNLAAAGRWAQERGLKEADTPILYLYEVDHLVCARLLIAQGQLEAAESLLWRLHHAATAAERYGSLIEILILQAITFAALQRHQAALAALDQALGLAEAEGFVRVFLDEGAPVVDLLRRAVAQDRHARYALHVLKAVGETAAVSQPLLEPLSERELEVLRRVAAGYSNQEIAQDLVVALSTVKKHISNMYGKLEADSRTQAVARARDLGLL